MCIIYWIRTVKCIGVSPYLGFVKPDDLEGVLKKITSEKFFLLMPGVSNTKVAVLLYIAG